MKPKIPPIIQVAMKWLEKHYITEPYEDVGAADKRWAAYTINNIYVDLHDHEACVWTVDIVGRTPHINAPSSIIERTIPYDNPEFYSKLAAAIKEVHLIDQEIAPYRYDITEP